MKNTQMAYTSSFSLLALALLTSFLTFGQEELVISDPDFIQPSQYFNPAGFIKVTPVNYDALDAVKKNGKLELGVELSPNLMEHVDAFINGDKRIEGLNPFDPEQIDITAYFTHVNDNGSIDSVRAYGFYYEEYRRNRDMKGWGKVTNSGLPRFRIRFTPRKTGVWNYQCQAIIHDQAGNERRFTSMPVSFNVVRSDLPGFMQVSENQHYLEVDGDLFLPLGMNMPTQGGPLTGYRHDGANPAEYVMYHYALADLKRAGGTYFRYMTTPWTTEIEFEVLGDYSDRLTEAWEMDQMVEKCEELGLRIHWDMSYMTQLTYMGVFGLYFWDWTDARDSMATCAELPNWFEQDLGFCYHTDKTYGVETVDEFLTSKDLIRFYQNRLRYMIARWGYSTSIGTLELYNEINYSGLLFGLTDDCQLDFSTEYKPYFNDTSYVRKLSEWQIEMGRFIKEDLKHFDHPYCVNFGGAPNYATPEEYPYLPEDGVALGAGDFTYFSKYVDIMSYNDYFRWPVKFEYQHSDLIKMKRFAKKQKFDANSYEKPLIYSEVGMGRHGCDDVFTFRQLYVMSPFTGAAGPGMPWHYNNNMPEYDSIRRRELGWSIMPVVQEFFADVPLHQGVWEAGMDVRKDLTAELYYLNEGKRAQRSVAVINNRTVNRFTMRESWCDENPDQCDCDLQDWELEMYPDVYETAQSFDWNDNRGIGGAQILKISGLEFTSKYKIVYYDGLTGEFVLEDTKWSDALGNLKLKYPELADTPDKSNGAANGSMLLVKIFKSDLDSFSTILE